MTEPKAEKPVTSDVEAMPMVGEVDTLPYRLGYEETPELKVTRAEIVAATLAGDDTKRIEALHHYLDGAEGIVDAMSDADNERARAQIGLIIAQALIWREAGEPVKRLRALLEAQEYADNMGLDDIVSVLAAELVESGELQ